MIIKLVETAPHTVCCLESRCSANSGSEGMSRYVRRESLLDVCLNGARQLCVRHPNCEDVMPRVVKVSSFLLLAGSLLLPACRNDVSSPTSESVPALEAGAATAVSTPLSFRQVSVGASHTCGVTTDDRAYCWGSNGDGQLGIGRPVSNPDGDFSTAPIAVAGGFRFLWVDAGTDFACGLATDERAYCWGANGLAQLGDNTRTSRSLPTAVRGGRRFRQLRSGHTHTCGVTYADVVFCWGDNSSGQLGDGTFHALRVPVQVIGGVRFRQVLTGGLHTCAMTQADQGYCWGNNDFGQLGDGTFTRRPMPVRISGGLLFPRLSAGDTHSCGVTADRRAYCWGSGRRGALGDGTFGRRFVPGPVSGGLRFINGVNAGNQRTCGVTSSNIAYCWGSNGLGGLGDGTQTDRPRPTRVAGGLGFRGLDVSTLGWTTCGVTTADRGYCWGNNFLGQVGNGRHADTPFVPTAVVGPTE